MGLWCWALTWITWSPSPHGSEAEDRVFLMRLQHRNLPLNTSLGLEVGKVSDTSDNSSQLLNCVGGGFGFGLWKTLFSSSERLDVTPRFQKHPEHRGQAGKASGPSFFQNLRLEIHLPSNSANCICSSCSLYLYFQTHNLTRCILGTCDFCAIKGPGKGLHPTSFSLCELWAASHSNGA